MLAAQARRPSEAGQMECCVLPAVGGNSAVVRHVTAGSGILPGHSGSSSSARCRALHASGPRRATAPVTEAVQGRRHLRSGTPSTPPSRCGYRAICLPARRAGSAELSAHQASDVDCRRCDAVCCRLPVLLQPGDRVPHRYVDIDRHGMETMAKDEDGWCAAIDPVRLRCSIYADRPAICRQFAMGGGDCLDIRARYRQQRQLGIPLTLD